MNYKSVLSLVLLLAGPTYGMQFRAIGPGGGGTPGALAVDPTDPDIAYVGLDCGGIRVTTDGGQSWRNANIGIDFDGSTVWNTHNALLTLPSGRVITVTGTGKLFISDDHAATWQQAFAAAGPLALLETSPHHPQTVFAANATSVGHHPKTAKLRAASTEAEFGPRIYVSRSSGRKGSWSVLNTDKKQNIPADAHLFSLGVDHENAKLMYATTDYGFYQSTDGGVRWRCMQAGLGPVVGTRILTVPDKPNIVYVSAHKIGDTPGGVYRSKDGGKTWQAMVNGLEGSRLFFALAADPGNADVLYLGCHQWGGGLFRSTDGGENWSLLFSGEQADPARVGVWHGDQKHVSVGVRIRVLPGDNDGDGFSDVIYFIGDNVGQVMKSVDGGRSFDQIVSRAKVVNGKTCRSQRGEIDFLCARRVVIDPNDPKHLWVTYFDWGLFESFDGGESFRLAYGPWCQGELIGANRGLALDVDDPSIVYVGTAVGGRGAGGVISNIGKGGYSIIGGRDKQRDGLPNSSVLDVIVAKWKEGDQEEKYLYATSGQHGVYRRDMEKGGWRSVSDGLAEGAGRIFPFMTHVPGTRTFFVSTNNGVYRSDDGLTWKQVTGPGTNYEKLTGVVSIIVDPNNRNRVFVSVMKDFGGHEDQGVYESKDNGLSWKRIANVSIPFEMAIDPSAESPLLYVASQGMGVYKVWEESADNWRTEIFADKHNGLDNTRVWSVTVCPHDPKRIYVATHGTGVFVGE